MRGALTVQIWKRARIPRPFGPFFLYLRVVRGHSIQYSVHLIRALGWSDSRAKRTAWRYYEDFLSGWWAYAEEDDAFDVWEAVGVVEEV